MKRYTVTVVQAATARSNFDSYAAVVVLYRGGFRGMDGDVSGEQFVYCIIFTAGLYL